MGIYNLKIIGQILKNKIVLCNFCPIFSDLDEDAQESKWNQYCPQSISFDYFGNATGPIDLNIFNHRMLPYLYHTKSYYPLKRDLCTIEDGQFEDFDSDA